MLPSLKSIRENVEYITLVYQTISNRGNPISEAALDAIESARTGKLLDEVCLYEPDFRLSAKANETNKRSLGLELAKAKNCTHFFTMDSDEFYHERN